MNAQYPQHLLQGAANMLCLIALCFCEFLLNYCVFVLNLLTLKLSTLIKVEFGTGARNWFQRPQSGPGSSTDPSALRALFLDTLPSRQGSRMKLYEGMVIWVAEHSWRMWNNLTYRHDSCFPAELCWLLKASGLRVIWENMEGLRGAFVEASTETFHN